VIWRKFCTKRQSAEQPSTCSPSVTREALRAFVERTGADELMITSQIFDHEARMRSYQITAQAAQSA
jgi:hypothetical protein